MSWNISKNNNIFVAERLYILLSTSSFLFCFRNFRHILLWFLCMYLLGELNSFTSARIFDWFNSVHDLCQKLWSPKCFSHFARLHSRFYLILAFLGVAVKCLIMIGRLKLSTAFLFQAGVLGRWQTQPASPIPGKVLSTRWRFFRCICGCELTKIISYTT